MFALQSNISGNMLILQVTGSILLPGAIRFQEEIIASVEGKKLPEVIMDLSATGRMDNAALGVLVTLSTLFAKRGMRLCLFNPAPHIKALIKDIGIEKFFPIFETEEELYNHALSDSD